MRIGDEVYIHGYVDEIRKDTVIIRNDGGYFGTVESEIKARPKGKWIMRHYIDKNRKGFNMWVCSECREEFSYDAETGVGITDANFCPNCGADMRAESEDEE